MNYLPGKISISIAMFILIIINGIDCAAQMAPRFSQYQMNEFVLNPSVAGEDGRTTYNFTARREWLLFSENIYNPETYAFSIQSRILRKSVNVSKGKSGNKLHKTNKGRVGLGSAILSDKYGAMNRTTIQLAYAYHIFLNNMQLSMGLSGNITQLKILGDNLVFANNDDEIMHHLADNPLWLPDFGLGASLLTNDYKVGLAVSNLFNSPYALGNSTINYNSLHLGQTRHFYLMASMHKGPSTSDWSYEPSFLFKMNNLFHFENGYASPASQLDISLKTYYKRMYWFGLSYRTMADFIAMAGFKRKLMYFSYAFDYGNNELIKGTYGSHEISIGFKFGDSARRYRWMQRY